MCVCVVEDDSLFEKVNKWPSLFAGCHCDAYSRWSREAFVSIAERWLSVEPSIVIFSTCKIIIYLRK